MNNAQAVQFSQLARLLFDRATSRWYRALLLEAVSTVAGALLALLALTGDWAFLGTLLVVGTLAAAQGIRLFAEDTFDTAQTMRRQAALSEGLGWPIDRTQAEDWRRKAGIGLVKRLAAEPRPADYYASQQPPGPRRLAEMTFESAFYTRHLFLAMRWVLSAALVVIAVALVAVVYVALSWPQAGMVAAIVAHVVATVVLIVIGLDVLGWVRRLSRQAAALREVEVGFDRLLGGSDIQERDVLRLVAEYDCELVDSIPIHPLFFRLKHDEIRELWEHRAGDAASSGDQTPDRS